MLRLTTALFLATLACACTPAAMHTAVSTAVETACLAVVSVEAPAAEPLCVLGAELAADAAQYVVEHAGARPAVTSEADGKTIVPVDLYAALRRRTPVLMRKAKRASRPCAGGSVAP